MTSSSPTPTPTPTASTTTAAPAATAPAPEPHHFQGGTVLDEDFSPDETVVIIGRGKRIRNHSGNKRFYALIQAELANYAHAPSKTEKSYLLAKVLDDIRAWNPQQLGFVKKNPTNGRWHSPKDSVARVTVAQAFRDALAGQYSSSKHNKQRRRQIAKGFLKEDDAADDDKDASRRPPPAVLSGGDKRAPAAAPVTLRSALEPTVGSMMTMHLHRNNMMGDMNNVNNVDNNMNAAMRMNMHHLGMDLRMNMGNHNHMGSNHNHMARKWSGQETLAQIRGIIQATADQLGDPVENVMSRVHAMHQQGGGGGGIHHRMHPGSRQQWLPQTMMPAPSSVPSHVSFQPQDLNDFYPTTSACEFPRLDGGGLGQPQALPQDHLLFEPLPVLEDEQPVAVAPAREQSNSNNASSSRWTGDAFSASEQTSSFFLHPLQQGV